MEKFGNYRPLYVRRPEDVLNYPLVVRFDPKPVPREGIINKDNCFNAPHWLAHVDGALDVLRQPDAWIGDSLYAIEQVELFVRWLKDCVMDECSGGNFDIRQSPIDPCVLEKSTDGGVTWQVGFNFSLCRPGTPPDIRLVAEVLQGLRALADEIELNGVTDVFPQAENSVFDPQRELKIKRCVWL